MKIKHITLLTVIFISASACSQKLNRSKTGVSFSYSEYKNMWMIGKDYYEGDTILINFAKEHPAELGIKNPDGDFFYLVYHPEIPTIKNGKPVYSFKEFKTVETLKMDPSIFKANPHDLQFNGNIRVFVKPGEYELFLGDNLSTDDGTPKEKLKIQFKGKRTKP
jgi:hypothetical protein